MTKKSEKNKKNKNENWAEFQNKVNKQTKSQRKAGLGSQFRHFSVKSKQTKKQNQNLSFDGKTHKIIIFTTNQQFLWVVESA